VIQKLRPASARLQAHGWAAVAVSLILLSTGFVLWAGMRRTPDTHPGRRPRQMRGAVDRHELQLTRRPAGLDTAGSRVE